MISTYSYQKEKIILLELLSLLYGPTVVIQYLHSLFDSQLNEGSPYFIQSI